MDTRSVFFAPVLLVVSLFPALAQASNAWPMPDCDGNPYWLTFSTMDFCIDKSEIEHLHHLNLSSPSLQVSFKPDDTGLPEILINGLSASKTTGGLHSRFNESVKEFFVRAFSGEVTTGDDSDIIRSVMTIDDATTLHHFTKPGLDAFVLLRNSDLWDEVYILKEGWDGSIQLSGQIDVSQVEWLLARLRW